MNEWMNERNVKKTERIKSREKGNFGSTNFRKTIYFKELRSLLNLIVIPSFARSLFLSFNFHRFYSSSFLPIHRFLIVVFEADKMFYQPILSTFAGVIIKFIVAFRSYLVHSKFFLKWTCVNLSFVFFGS